MFAPCHSHLTGIVLKPWEIQHCLLYQKTLWVRLCHFTVIWLSVPVPSSPSVPLCHTTQCQFPLLRLCQCATQLSASSLSSTCATWLLSDSLRHHITLYYITLVCIILMLIVRQSRHSTAQNTHVRLVELLVSTELARKWQETVKVWLEIRSPDLVGDWGNPSKSSVSVTKSSGTKNSNLVSRHEYKQTFCRAIKWPA
jgi:hypothetical protein